VSVGRLQLQWAEVYQNPLNLVSVFPTSVVSCNALQGFYKEFLSSNNLLTISVEYVTMGTAYTPIRLIQLRQCRATYPKYVSFQHFPGLRLSVSDASLQVRSAERPK
jgi:hypothetical protein